MRGAKLSSKSTLDLVFSAPSVAVFGASRNPKKLGHLAVKLLMEGKYPGRLVPINPAGGEILGLPVSRSLADASGRVDVALSVVPAAQTLEVLHASVAHGVDAVIAITSGFAEAGASGRANQRALESFLRSAPLRVLGPNCEGLAAPRNNILFSFSPMFLGLRPGGVSIVSQSGAISGIAANRLSTSGIGIANLLTTGNEVDITAADALDWLADDSATDVVLMYLEEIRDGEKFAMAARRMLGRKTIIVVKTGRGQAGQRAARSHTGALAGRDTVIGGVFAELGILRAPDTMAAIDMAAAAALGKRLRGRRIGIVSIVGGLAVETADLAELAGFAVPPLRRQVQHALKLQMPFFGSSRNPIDLTGSALERPDLMRSAIDALMEDPGIDGVVAIVTFARDPAFARAIVEAHKRYDKPILACWAGRREQTPESLDYFLAEGFPVFDAPARVVSALRAIAPLPSALRRLQDRGIADGSC